PRHGGRRLSDCRGSGGRGGGRGGDWRRGRLWGRGGGAGRDGGRGGRRHHLRHPQALTMRRRSAPAQPSVARRARSASASRISSANIPMWSGQGGLFSSTYWQSV